VVQRFWINAIVAGALFAAPFAAKAEEPGIKVGAMIALSGPAAYLGDPVQKSLKMLVDNYNARGGIAGRKLTLVTYDTEGNTGKAVQLFRRLAESDQVVAIIGPSTTGESLALKSVANELKVPMISFGAGTDIVVPPEPYVFKVPPTDEVEIRQLVVDFARRGVKKLALLYAASPYGQSGASLMQQLAPTAGISLVAQEQFQLLDTDMTAQIIRARDSGADAMLIWATDPAATLVVKQAVALNFAKPIYNSPAVADPKFITKAGAAADGTYVQGSRLLVAADLPADHPQRSGLVWLTDSYRKRFNEEPPQNAGHPYDALLLIESAVTGTSGELSGEIVARGLSKAKACGANGCFKMSDKDHNGLSPDSMVILKAVKGAWKLDE